MTRCGAALHGHYASVKNADSGQERAEEHREPDVRHGDSLRIKNRQCCAVGACTDGPTDSKKIRQLHPHKLNELTPLRRRQACWGWFSRHTGSRLTGAVT